MRAEEKLRYLLLQIRKPSDPVRAGEVKAFARTLGCDPRRISPVDLIRTPPDPASLRACDVVLIGGAGDFSVPEGGPWLEAALDAMRSLHARRKPTFASCWGFQALAAALGGRVVTDLDCAEIGTLKLEVTRAGRSDPVFAGLGRTFLAHVGHQDTVDVLPPDTTCLARTAAVANHAFKCNDAPIYATQFHSELSARDMESRVLAYPNYVEKLAGIAMDDFLESLRPTPEANGLILRFVRHVLGA